MTELVIHIGDCKAGSTAIQKALQSGDWTAEGGKSLVYARTGLRRQREFANHHPLANALFDRKQLERAPGLYARLGREWAGCTADVLAVSSERFEFVAPEALQGILEQKIPEALSGLRLIVYVRPHAERVVSGYAQRVKQGKFTGTLEEFYERSLGRRRFDFARRLGRWRDVFGDRLTVRAMIRSQLHRNCAAHDFLAQAIGTDSARLTRAAEANVSISLEDLAVIRDFRRSAAAGPRARALINRLVQSMEETPSAGTRLRLHRALAERIAGDYAEDAARVDADFLCGTAMTDALRSSVETAADEPQSLDPQAVLPPEMQRLSRVWATASLATAPRRRAGQPSPGATERAPE